MKIYQKQLEKKYGSTNITGKKYQTLMSEILQNQQAELIKRVGPKQKKEWQKINDKLTENKKIYIPDNIDYLARTIYFRKAADRGDLITQTLKDQLTNDLRYLIQDFKTKGGKSKVVYRGGRKIGTINPELTRLLRDKISNTFESYVKKDKTGKFKYPANIETIARTESRAIINNIAYAYAKEIQSHNPDKKIVKQWIHNAGLSKVPRIEHKEMDGVKVFFNQNFKLNRYKKSAIGLIHIGSYYMTGPHDVMADAGDVINCNCELMYTVQ